MPEYYFDTVGYKEWTKTREEAEAEAEALWVGNGGNPTDPDRYAFVLGSMLVKYNSLHHEFKKLEAAYRSLQKTKECNTVNP